jgi:hypothetical protein
MLSGGGIKIEVMDAGDSDIFGKLILVFYVDVRNMNSHEISEYITRAREGTLGEPEDTKKMIRYFIPIYGESRVECLNPPGWCCCNEDKKNTMKLRLQEVDMRLDRVCEALFPPTRRVIVEKICA